MNLTWREFVRFIYVRWQGHVLDIRQEMWWIGLDDDVYQDGHESVRTLVLMQMSDQTYMCDVSGVQLSSQHEADQR